MEEVHESGRAPTGGNNSELEKFKRRLIRAVARMLLHEKRNEDEVWVGLKKETGCDCKELWSRMYALTAKKLERLLEAEDRVNQLPKAARMSITDWLMFDTVLVHEDFDVIGMSQTLTEDRKVLKDLFELVEEYKIEFLAGDQLTDAWLRLTMRYNGQDRQCTPMLLQRRWYQLKLSTRARFYKFWSIYKGVAKRRHLGEPYKPTQLQAAIAMRYKPLVVKPFMVWEELLKNGLVILPEQFEYKGNNFKTNKASNIEDISTDFVPDVLCVEPAVETIEIDSDSETEIEYRNPVKNDDLASITIKKEPVDDIDIDENTHYENRQERMLHFAEAAMEATAMELDEIELANDTEAFLSSNPEVESESLRNKQRNEEIISDDVNPNQDNINNLSQAENDMATPVSVIPEDDRLCLIEDQNKTIPPISDIHVNALNEENNENPVSDITSPLLDNEIESLPVSDAIVKDVHLIEDEVPEGNDIEMQMEQETVLPQITSIFGGVDISNETLSQISLLTAQITNSANKDKLKNVTEIQIANSPSIPLHSDSSNASNNGVLVPDDTLDDKSNSVVDGKVTKNTWFGELSNDIEFADDGIQFVDDDNDEYHISEIKCEIDEEDTRISEKVDEDVPKVDEKLLMVPMVKMVKLDDMNILPLHLLAHIDNKSLIDIIAFKSNPIKKLISPSHHPSVIKEEVDSSEPTNTGTRPKIRIKFEDDESESSDDDTVDESKKVKLSSVLLQKPRNRSYNPLNLCKNPDFNTRLKKLNVGFFSSARNRLLLKACKPLSIDVSKAFESKLVKGKMYLKMSNNDDLHTHTYTAPKVSNQNVSVLPSAMAVQSLIDNTKGDIPPASYSSIPLRPVPLTSERNKVINLPDISEIRRINQNLLTAEVTPLRLSSHTQVPVTLVKTTNTNQNMYSTKYGKAIAGPASRTKQLNTQIIDITKEHNTNKDASLAKNTDKDSSKPVNKYAPWRPRPNPRKPKPQIPWFSNKNSIYSDDTLLALDTLNKMLYLLTETDPTLTDNSGIKGSSKGKGKGKKQSPLKEKESTLKPTLNDDENDDVQVIGETKLDNADANLCPKPKIKLTKVAKSGGKKSKFVYCCWARERICQLIFTKKRITKHNCPFPLCLCCCRNALLEFIRKKVKRANKNKKTTGASTSDHSVTDDDTVGLEDIDVSADMAEITPINNKIVTNEAAINMDNEISMNETKININAELSTNKTAINIDTAIKKSKVFTNEAADNTDTEISTSENIINIDVEMSTNEAAGNTGTEISTDETAVGADKPILVGTQINDNSSGDVIIGAEISVKTSNNVVSIQSDDDPGTVENAAITNTKMTNTKPRIRIRPSLGPKGATETIRRRRLQINQRIVPPEHLTTIEKPKKIVIIDPTKPFKTPEKSQTAVFLDPTVTNILPKTYVNQKMIYLNSKQISTLPTDNPILLGKNKILLTTAKFPANFKSFEAYVANLKQTFALPKGIQLVLLPSGRVTYIKDSKQSISDEFMTALPHLLIAIQQQINGPPEHPTDISSQPEVINLSDDDAADIEDNTDRTSSDDVSVDNINQIKEIDKSQTENIVETETVSLNLDETKTEIDKSQTENIVETETVSLNLDETKTTESTIDRITPQSDVNISELVTTNVETVECSNGKFNEPVITENANENVNTKSDVAISESSSSNIETVENDSGKCNNILSDLMAMSGIEPLDVTPTPQLPEATTGSVEVMPAQIDHSEKHPLNPPLQRSINPPLLQPINSRVEQNSLLELHHTESESEEHAQKMEANYRKILSAELTPITSLSELKYACAQNGAFFKLDLETGLLLPINVCMKKFTECTKPYTSKQMKLQPKVNPTIDPKPVIDLTDDDVSVVPQVTPTQPNSLLVSQPSLHCSGNVINSDIQDTNNVAGEINPKGIDMNFTIASVSSGSTRIANRNIDPSIGGTNVGKDGRVKPLKLCKVRERPTILERKLKVIQHRVKEAHLKQDLLRRKLKRKQQLNNFVRENEENAVYSYNIVSSDDSSDEEPLAKIASKMRTAEKTDTGDITNVNNSTVSETELPVNSRVESTEMKLADELPNADNELPNEGNELPNAINEMPNAVNELPNTVNELLNDDPDFPMAEDEEMPMECLDEAILEEDEADEDCILGV